MWHREQPHMVKMKTELKFKKLINWERRAIWSLYKNEKNNFIKREIETRSKNSERNIQYLHRRSAGRSKQTNKCRGCNTNQKIGHAFFSDDIVVLTETEDDFKHLLNKINKIMWMGIILK